MENEIITLYPSNWLYNAGVIGLLKVIAYGKGENTVEKWLNTDGTVKIERGIFKDSVDFYKNYNNSKGEKGLPLVGKNKRYPNYLQEGDELDFENYTKTLADIKKSGDPCGLCTQNFFIDLSHFDDNVKKINSRVSSNFQTIHDNLLGPSTGEFPNAFWNLSDSISICPLCSYLIIHHHIPFEDAKIRNGQIFINAPSFKIMWYLNKYTSKFLSKRNNYQLREILGISFMELAQRIFMTLGVWSIMNIEMIIIKEEYDPTKKEMKREANYYSLPYETSRLLLNKDIASLIKQTKEDFILEIILNGKFDRLLELNQKILRYAMTSLSAFEDRYLSNIRNRDVRSLKNLSAILPKLYVKISSILKEG